MKLGGKRMTKEELERLNLECDLIDIVNRCAWPHGEKVAGELLRQFDIQPKHERVPVHVRKKG